MFDAILVYSGYKFINILPITSRQYEEVRKYFLDNGLEDIQNKLKERHQVTGNKKEFHTRGDY